jgi:hypothetical protein
MTAVVTPPMRTDAPQAEPQQANQPTEVQPSSVPATEPEAPKPAKSRDLAAVARAQYAARQATKQAAEQSRHWEQQLQAERQARQQEQQELAQLRALRERLKGGEALALSTELGVDPNKTIEDYVGKSAPEKQLEALRKELEQEKAERQNWLRDRQQEQEQVQRAAMAQAEAQQLQSFVPFIANNAVKYTYINAEMDPEEIVEEARKIQAWAKQVRWKNAEGVEYIGVQYSYDAVAEAIDKKAKLLHDRRTERRSKLLTPQQRETPVAAPEKTNGQTRPSTRTEPKATRRSPPMSRDQEAEHDLAILRAAMAKDAANRK